MKKSCFNCHWAIERPTQLYDKKCLNCQNFNKWQLTKEIPELPQPPETPEVVYPWIPMQPCIYEAAISVYDRYMQVVLTAPVKEDSPDMINMSQFINHLIVRGMISYSEFLVPMEKELGII